MICKQMNDSKAILPNLLARIYIFLIIFLTLLFSASVVWADTTRFDFTYPDRLSMLTDGWDFLAVTISGGTRDTEQTTGVVVSYDQAAHPGVVRIPADVGDLWAGLNNTRNSLFRDLPANWTSIRMKLSFAPTQNYQQAGLLVYQDDDNYVQVTRIYEYGNKVTFAREAKGGASIVSYRNEAATQGLCLRLDREPETERISGYYSLDGADWVSLGNVTQTLNNPRLAIVVGASPGGFPNADMEWATVSTEPNPPPDPTFFLYPSQLLFNGVSGTDTPTFQTVNVISDYSINWIVETDASWLMVTPGSGITPGSFNLTVDTNELTPGIYSGIVSVIANDAINSPQSVQVTLIVNTNVAAKVSIWKDAQKGVLSVSVDDGSPSCFDELEQNGFKGTYVTNGTEPPAFYSDFYNAGMELGAHLVSHPCYAVDEETLRSQEIEPNIDGLSLYATVPIDEIVTLAWPCGFNTMEEQAIASDYFLSARGYNLNQLENRTPANFLNLKSYNSHEHTPYPPSDLKTVVDMAEQQGKWSILVFHSTCNDDGAIDYAATKEIWVAPIGTVVKYILLRDRFILSDYQETLNQITFSYYRLDIPPSTLRDFETAITPADEITIVVDTDDMKSIASVRIDGNSFPYQVKNIEGNIVLLINTPLDTIQKNVQITYGASPPIIQLDPTILNFTATQGTSPSNQTVALTNTGGGILDWTATVASRPAGWLSVSPTGGTGDASLTVSVDSAGLAIGTYTGNITISGSGATNTPQTVNVTLTVDPITPCDDYETSCIDGIDNDCDGDVDCNDVEDCSGDSACTCKTKREWCSNDAECCSNDCRGKKCK